MCGWVDKLLQHIPSQALSAILTRMAKDLKRHSKGFPDLFIWRSDAYQLLEVKSETDQISVPQYQWIQFFVRHGVNAATLRVYYSDEKDVA